MFCFLTGPAGGTVWMPATFDEALARDDSIIASTITEAQAIVAERTGLNATVAKVNSDKGNIDVIIAYEHAIHILTNNDGFAAVRNAVANDGFAYVLGNYNFGRNHGEDYRATRILPIGYNAVYKLTLKKDYPQRPRHLLTFTKLWGMTAKLMTACGHDAVTRHSAYHPVTRALMLERCLTWLAYSDFHHGNRHTNKVLTAEIADYKLHRTEYLKEFKRKHATNTEGVLKLVACFDKRFAPRQHAKDQKAAAQPAVAAS